MLARAPLLSPITIPPLVSTLLLFVGTLIMLETGRRLGIGRRRQETDSDRSAVYTAYLRLELSPQEQKLALQELFRHRSGHMQRLPQGFRVV